jgi:hypothetical protein
MLCGDLNSWTEYLGPGLSLGLLLRKQPLEPPHRIRCVTRVVVVGKRKDLDIPNEKLHEHVFQLANAIHDRLVPACCLLFNRSAIAQPPHIPEIRRNQIQVPFDLPRPRHQLWSINATPRSRRVSTKRASSQYLFRISTANLYPFGSFFRNGSNRAKNAAPFLNFNSLKYPN